MHTEAATAETVLIQTTARTFDLLAHRRCPQGSFTGRYSTYSADDQLIAVSQPHEVVVIDARNGTVVRRFPRPPTSFPLGTAFSTDKSMLAIALSDFAGVEVYSLASGERLYSKRSTGWVFDVAFSVDGSTLAWVNGTSAEMVRVNSWERSIPTARPTVVEPGNLCFSTNGKTLAVCCGLIVQLFDTKTGELRSILRGHAQRVRTASFDESGDRVVTSSVDRTVRIWDVSSGTLLNTLLGHEAPTIAARFLASAQQFEPSVISVDENNRVRMWNLDTNGPVFSARASSQNRSVTQLDYSPDGSTLRASGQNSLITIGLHDMPRLESVAEFQSQFIRTVPGRDLLLRNVEGKRVDLESTITHTALWTITTAPPSELYVSPEGVRFATKEPNWEIAIRNVSDGSEVARVITDGSGVHEVIFSPDGKTLAIPEYSGAVRLWDVATGSLVAELAGRGDRARCLCWSADGSLIAFADAVDGVTVIDARTHQSISRIPRIGGQVWSIAFSPDRSRIVIGAQDRIAHLYETETGNELLQLRDHTGTVMTVAWSPDGRRLATGGYDQKVFVYDSAEPDRLH
jgi:WD40 repeat protein